MAKRQAKFRRTETPDGVKIDDYGIYQEQSFIVSGSELTAAEVELHKRRASSRRPHWRPSSAIEELHCLQARMRMTISFYVMPDEGPLPPRWTTITADLGNGPQKLVCTAQREAGVQQAAGVLGTITMLGNLSEREARIFLEGIHAGRMLEMMDVLPSEFDALRGKQLAEQLERRQAAGDERKQRRHAAVAAKIKTQARPNYDAACRAVANDEGLEDHKSIKLDVPNVWTARPREKK